MRAAIVLSLSVPLLLLGGCGQRSGLKPETGKPLPVAPYGSEERKTADALLTPPQQATPGRNVEMRKRSEVREDDPFDLPPAE